MQRHQHLQNTLSQYGKAVVREMRALAAERDLPSNQPTDDASTSNALQSDADRSGGADGSAGSVVGADDKKVVATNKKKKGKAKKNKVTHIVDKMLFNYRNIGKFSVLLCECIRVLSSMAAQKERSVGTIFC